MDVYRNLSEVSASDKSRIVMIGNFDGLHKGHQSLIKTAKNKVDEMGGELMLLTFEPHPRHLFRPDDPTFRITPLSLKLDRLQKLEIDAVVCLEFNWDFASQSAEEFVQDILMKGLQADHVVVGEDFCFGQLRKGTPGLIRELGLEVTTIRPEIGTNGEKYSSSTIRQLLRAGKLEEANDLLGWEWEVRGEVKKGDQRGRELGYPTANVPLCDTLHPAYGIYACYVQIEGEGKWHPAATNIGIRPMFELQEGQVEAHILQGFNRDIYGKILRVKPVKRIRGEAKFDSLEELCEQMAKDCEECLQILT